MSREEPSAPFSWLLYGVATRAGVTPVRMFFSEPPCPHIKPS